VVRRGWVSSREFLLDLTLCQLLPGPNFSNLAVAIGRRLAGSRGALAAALGVLVPGALVLLTVSALYGGGGLAPGARNFVRGMSAAVVGLVLMTAGRLMHGALRRRSAALLALLTFLAVGPLHVNTLLVIVVVAGAGLWLNRPGAPPVTPAP
jgi:chromate transporter